MKSYSATTKAPIKQQSLAAKTLNAQVRNVPVRSPLSSGKKEEQKFGKRTSSHPNIQKLNFLKMGGDEALLNTMSFGSQQSQKQTMMTSEFINKNRQMSSNLNPSGSQTMRQFEPKKLSPMIKGSQMTKTMRDSRKSTASLISNTSSSQRKFNSQYQNLYTVDANTDKPLPQILKASLKKGREILIQKNIITDSETDKTKFPTYDLSDPLKCTPRELTLKLVKQHEFLIHRVVALKETIMKQNISKYAEGTEMLKELDAEEEISRQDLSIRSLKHDNSFMMKQLESFKMQICEKDEELESQTNFIDSVREQMQQAQAMRNLNSQLQLKLMEAERQANDAYQQVEMLQDQSAFDRQAAETMRFELDELRDNLDHLNERAAANDLIVKSQRSRSPRVQSPPLETSQFANEVKQQLLHQEQQLNQLNASITYKLDIIGSSPPNPNLSQIQGNCGCTCKQNRQQQYINSHCQHLQSLSQKDNSGVISFAKDDSRNIGHGGDFFSLQALNDSLSVGNTMVEFNLKAQGVGLKQKRTRRSKSSKSGVNKVGKFGSKQQQQQQAIGLVNTQHDSIEDNIRNQLLMTSLNEEILDQMSKEQVKTKLAEEVMLKWNKMKDKYDALKLEQEETKQELDQLLDENNSTRQKFTALLDTFQQFILTQDKQKRQGGNKEEIERKEKEIEALRTENLSLIEQLKEKQRNTAKHTNAADDDLLKNNHQDKKSITEYYAAVNEDAIQKIATSRELIDSLDNKFDQTKSPKTANELLSAYEQRYTPGTANRAQEEVTSNDQKLQISVATSKQLIGNTSIISEQPYQTMPMQQQQQNKEQKPPGQLSHYEKKSRRTSPMHGREGHKRSLSKNSCLQIEADASQQSSFSFAVSPSQKPLFIQSVYLAAQVRNLLSSWESKAVSNDDKETGAQDSVDKELIQVQLMASLSNLDNSQLLAQMLASLQVTLTFVQNLQDGIGADEQSNLCEVKQNWQNVIEKVRLPADQKDQVVSEIRGVVDNLSQMYVNKTLELAMYRQAIVSKGSDAQQMLKASIDDLMSMKMENAKLKEAIDGKNFEKIYCAQQMQQQSVSTQGGQFAQSFGMTAGESSSQFPKPPLDHQFQSIQCNKCVEMKTAYAACEEQMKEGKAKLEESAIIVQEVAKEIKIKDKIINNIAAKLVQTLFVLDGKLDEKEAVSQQIDRLSDLIYQKVTQLTNKSKKEKNANKQFQTTMLNELANLNKVLIEKRKRRGDRHNNHQRHRVGGTKQQNDRQHGNSGAAEAYVSPSFPRQSKLQAQQQQQQQQYQQAVVVSDDAQKFYSSYGQQAFGSGLEQSQQQMQQNYNDYIPQRERATSVTSTDQENQQFMNVFQDLKEKMLYKGQESDLPRSIPRLAITPNKITPQQRVISSEIQIYMQNNV